MTHVVEIARAGPNDAVEVLATLTRRLTADLTPSERSINSPRVSMSHKGLFPYVATG